MNNNRYNDIYIYIIFYIHYVITSFSLEFSNRVSRGRRPSLYKFFDTAFPCDNNSTAMQIPSHLHKFISDLNALPSGTPIFGPGSASHYLQRPLHDAKAEWTFADAFGLLQLTGGVTGINHAAFASVTPCDHYRTFTLVDHRVLHAVVTRAPDQTLDSLRSVIPSKALLEISLRDLEAWGLIITRREYHELFKRYTGTVKGAKVVHHPHVKDAATRQPVHDPVLTDTHRQVLARIRPNQSIIASPLCTISCTTALTIEDTVSFLDDLIYLKLIAWVPD